MLDFEYAYKVGYRSKYLIQLIIDSSDIDEVLDPIIRVHPDPYIWQGSIIEWV